MTAGYPFQQYPPLPPDIEAALRASIAKFGVLVPTVRDQHGHIIDGHHRTRIAAELNVDCPVEQVKVRSDVHANELARTLNEDRRHLTTKQRQEVAVDLRIKGHSTRAISGALRAAQSTIVRDLAAGEPYGSPEQVDLSKPLRVIGRDGKSYPATQPKDTTNIEPSHRRESVPDHLRKRVRFDTNRQLEAFIGRLDGLDNTIFDLADFNSVDPELVGHWLPVLKKAVRVLNRLAKELNRVQNEQPE